MWWLVWVLIFLVVFIGFRQWYVHCIIGRKDDE